MTYDIIRCFTRTNSCVGAPLLTVPEDSRAELRHPNARDDTLDFQKELVEETRYHQPAAIQRLECLSDNLLRVLQAAGVLALSVVAGLEEIGPGSARTEGHND